MTAHGGTLLNREAAAIAEAVYGKKTNISDHLLDVLRVHLVLTGRPSDVPKKTAAAIVEAAKKLAKPEEVQP